MNKIKLVRENLSEPLQLYMVEKTEHTISINNKPVLDKEFSFFVDKTEAMEYKRSVSFTFKSNFNKVSIRKVDSSIFKWWEMSKHKAIANGVERNFYYLRGQLNKKHPNTNDNIFIEDQFDVETGAQIKFFLENN